MSHPIVIVGSGIAGFTVAQDLRVQDTTIPITLLTQDPGYYYPKPQLSAAFARHKTPDSLIKFSADQMADKLGCDLNTLSIVQSIHPQNQKIQFEKNHKKTNLSYSKLILAIGAWPIHLPILPDIQDRIFQVNDLEDYKRFRTILDQHPNASIAIIGSGLVGSEFASDLNTQNFQVHLISRSKTVLNRLIPPEIGQVVTDAMIQSGIQIHSNCTPTALQAQNTKLTLSLSNHKTITVDFVLSAIGLQPRLELAKQAGLKTDVGIVVDPYLETSEKNIYAIGDCVQSFGEVRQFINPIRHGACALAQTLLGNPTPVQYPPMRISVKTTACPVSCCQPSADITGDWVIDQSGQDIKAVFIDSDHQPKGFILTGACTKDKHALLEQIT